MIRINAVARTLLCACFSGVTVSCAAADFSRLTEANISIILEI
jgi:hypothetical protein